MQNTLQDRIMIFHPSENGRFIRNFYSTPFNWTGENIGDVTQYLNPIPAIKGNKLFLMTPVNQYVILQKYDVMTHLIEIMKRIFGLYGVPYNICIYKNKPQIMYMYTPFNEMEYSMVKKKKEDITDEERKIFFFHWMLGIKGKIIKIYPYDPILGYNGNYIIASNRKYSSINYEANRLSDASASKFFGNYHVMYNTAVFFNSPEKLGLIRQYMNDQNDWWYQEIERRIKQYVSISH